MHSCLYYMCMYDLNTKNLFQNNLYQKKLCMYKYIHICNYITPDPMHHAQILKHHAPILFFSSPPICPL